MFFFHHETFSLYDQLIYLTFVITYFGSLHLALLIVELEYNQISFK